jgi:acetylornithine/N-succinyldiaminopimelate aminotransferase
VDAVANAIGPETAGILVEPIQGEGGIRPLPDSALQALRRLCDDHGILLVLDEVQSGMGRTGRLFAHERAGVRPDIMAIAKGLGGGFPVGACLATEAAAAGMTAGTHGTTFGGNPLAMAVANAVLDVVLEDAFLDRVQAAGRHLAASLQASRQGTLRCWRRCAASGS